jgi:hypothetical protein
MKYPRFLVVSTVMTVFILCTALANASGNFVVVPLPNGITVELPKNWTVLSDNRRITIDTWVQAKRELAGDSHPSSDLAFAANYYDEQGKAAAIFNVRYYPDLDVTQGDARGLSASDIKELDAALRNEVSKAEKQYGIRILSWVGTTKHSINGITMFLTEYRRQNIGAGAPFCVRLARILNGPRSFTITISYREDQEYLLKAICDRIIHSIRI